VKPSWAGGYGKKYILQKGGIKRALALTIRAAGGKRYKTGWGHERKTPKTQPVIQNNDRPGSAQRGRNDHRIASRCEVHSNLVSKLSI